MDAARLIYLMDACLKGAGTDEMRQELLSLMMELGDDDRADKLFEAALDSTDPVVRMDAETRSVILQSIFKADAFRQVKSASRVRRVHLLNTSWFRYAAVLLLIAATALYLYVTNQSHEVTTVKRSLQQPVIQPGGNKAVLTLADGSSIVLDSAANGNLVSQGGTNVVKLDEGKLAYQANNGAEGAGYNTISTPKGGQYQIVLPDGTKVWLNAASSVRFPTTFRKERVIEITGESYLEIAPDKIKPFFVKSGRATIQVLGTSFNINAYSNENAIRTTVITGSIRVSTNAGKVLLKPGQQASIDGSALQVVNADVTRVTAWKNGLFNFEGVGVAELMRQIERWYNVEVIYEGAIPAMQFAGAVKRNTSLNDLMESLQKMGVRNKLNNNGTITIFP